MTSHRWKHLPEKTETLGIVVDDTVKLLDLWQCSGCDQYARSVRIASDDPGVRERELALGLEDIRAICREECPGDAKR